MLLVVNEQDEVIAIKPKEACGPEDITRVSGLFLYNSQREVLIAKRTMDKEYDPGKWSFAVAGTVEEGETYLSNILKETEEEIGLQLTARDVHERFHGLWQSTHKFFYTQYDAKVDVLLSELRLQEDEVAELRFVPAEELFQWITSRPQDFVASMPRAVEMIRQVLKW